MTSRFSKGFATLVTLVTFLVNVHAAEEGAHFPRSVATAFVVHPDGYLLTNAHAIGKEKDGESARPEWLEVTVRVTLGHKSYEATVCQVHQRYDLALLKVDAKGLTALPLGDSDVVKLGEEIRVFGYPHPRELGRSLKVTRGTISGIEEEPRAHFQTDADTNPGNSGGPVINGRGEVIAVHQAGVLLKNKVNISIPINQAKQLLKKEGLEIPTLAEARELAGTELVRRSASAVSPLRTRAVVWAVGTPSIKDKRIHQFWQQLSPNGEYFAYGCGDLNGKPGGELGAGEWAAMRMVHVPTGKYLGSNDTSEADTIRDWCWLPDSSGLAAAIHYRRSLALLDVQLLRKHTVKGLTFQQIMAAENPPRLIGLATQADGLGFTGLRLIDLTTVQVVKSIPERRIGELVVFWRETKLSQNGQYLFWESFGELKVIDLEQQRIETLQDRGVRSILGVTSDGGKIAYRMDDGIVILDRRENGRLTIPGKDATFLGFLKDGQQAAILRNPDYPRESREKAVQIWKVTDSELSQTVSLPKATPKGFVWELSRNGKVLAGSQSGAMMAAFVDFHSLTAK